MQAIIALAIPFFFLAIAIEVRAARRAGVQAYRFADAITDLSCGVGNQVMALLFGAALLGAYAALYDRFTLVRFEDGSPWPWVIGIVGVDFLYYWWHRFSHEVNVLWAAHVVHHQSEDYNLAVALRQALFTSFTSVPFYLPLVFLGVPAPVYAASIALSLVYQFFIHTELVRRLPAPIEYVMNTPSHHRVHHATNPEYLDRNYAAIFIVWDRLFGTFEPERAPCVYGTTKPFESFNPIWANLAYFGDLARVMRRRHGLVAKVGVLFERPGWNPAKGRVELPPFTPREAYRKFDVEPPSRGVKVWVALQFAIAGVALTGLLLVAADLSPLQLYAAGACLFAATLAWGGLLERRAWGRMLEGARVAASVAVVAWIVLAR